MTDESNDRGGHETAEVRFRSGDADCVGTLWWPDRRSDGDLACVVMANGVSLTRHDGVPLFAERFATAGHAVLTFDFRHLGDSDGEPRQRLDNHLQDEDLAAAVDHARSIEGIDPAQVVTWGFSLGGSRVIEHAATDDQLAGSLVLAPMADGLAWTRMFGIGNALRLAGAATKALVTRKDLTIPVVERSRSLSLFSSEEAMEGFHSVVGEGSPWRNEARPRPTQPPALLRPVRKAAKIQQPIWVGLMTQDTMVPQPAIEAVAERAPQGELSSFESGHFGGFGDELDNVVTDQLDFLERHLQANRAA